ncbi:hypothetical protein FOB24_11420 [Citrobacter werkmanii]|nr:hypothetical protein FOB24_11420 [Citrobacter werkmanii]
MSYTHCTYCGSRLHTRANCPETWGGSSRLANLRCGYCMNSRNQKRLWQSNVKVILWCISAAT